MLVQIKDLISGQIYDININQICCFTKTPNDVGVMKYQIILTNNIVITVTHKRWNRLKRIMS
jgi:hypothetical protein